MAFRPRLSPVQFILATILFLKNFQGHFLDQTKNSWNFILFSGKKLFLPIDLPLQNSKNSPSMDAKKPQINKAKKTS